MNKQQISQLELILDSDQYNIKLFKEGKISIDELIKIQKDNFEFVKFFIKENGFPYIRISSKKAYRAAFLTIQHSNDIGYIKETINLFKNKTSKEIIKGDLAYLIDRARIMENKPQIYGTQYRIEDKKIVFFEIENYEDINNRRGELDMESFEDYKEKVYKLIV